MPLHFSRERTVGVLERIRELYAKRQLMNQFVRLQAKVKFVDNHLAVATVRNGKFTLLTDEPKDYGGEDMAVAPLEYFVAGFAMCEAAQYLWQIADMGMQVNDFSLEVKTRNNWTPIMPEGTTETPELSRVELFVTLDSPESEEKCRELVRRAARHCPAHNSLAKPIAISTYLDLNGQRMIVEGEAPPVDADPHHDGETLAVKHAEGGGVS